MIDIYNKNEIIIAHVHDSKSFRQIAKDLHVDRRVVSNYVKEYETQKQVILEQAHDNIKNAELISLSNALVEKPKYDSSNRTKRKVTPEMITPTASL